MKPVAYVKYVIGGAPYFVPVIAGVAKIEGYPADYTELFSADQLRQAKVKMLREAAENAPSAWVESVDKYLRRMADEIERSKT